MMTPEKAWEKLNMVFGKRHKIAFLSAFAAGLLIHLPVMLSDIPNHDGLASMYFDQNMITSGRWFLTVACGFSSYFTVPWVIGLIGMFFLGIASAVLTELLELKSTIVIVLSGGMLVAFPALASTFAYVFTLDGYMLALLLMASAVLLTKKYRTGWIGGAICLAFSMGIYQAYLPFAILLCMYEILMLLADDMWKKDRSGLIRKTGSYLGMGVLGAVLYYVILRILLLIQGKELASYQGIGSASPLAGGNLFATFKAIYVDFAAFTLKGGILYSNLFSAVALLLLVLMTICVTVKLAVRRGWWKKTGFYGVLVLCALSVPVVNSCIRLMSPGLNYHLLMRYQWVLYPMLMLAFLEKNIEIEGNLAKKTANLFRWGVVFCGFILLFCYGLADNIAYTNLQRKYEKTYAYCLRLLDRIEQTPGYYQGIPVAINGVVGDDLFPVTEITGKVTGNMIGLSGDMLFYTGANYESFFRNYLGATLNIVDVDTMGQIYYTEEYMAMDSFPGPDSTKVVNGILYVKTENKDRSDRNTEE